MDEKKTVKENVFKNWMFYLAYFLTLAICFALSWVLTGMNSDGYWIYGILLFCIPYILVGLIVWAIVRRINRSIALGILLGSITPFLFILVSTGGCGLFAF